MSPVRIRTRKNGPLVVQGAFSLVDADGNPFELPNDKPAVALCRCGHSGIRPFCDGTHREKGFVADERAPVPD